MRSEHESKIAYVYGILLIIILIIVVVFLLCDANILAVKYCTHINKWVDILTIKINHLLRL